MKRRPNNPLRLPIYTLGLRPWLRGKLLALNLRSIGDILAVSPEALIKVAERVGPVAVGQISRALAREGIVWGTWTEPSPRRRRAETVGGPAPVVTDRTLRIAEQMRRLDIGGHMSDDVRDVFRRAARAEAVPVCTCEMQEDDAFLELQAATLGLYAPTLPSSWRSGPGVRRQDRVEFESAQEKAEWINHYDQYIT